MRGMSYRMPRGLIVFGFFSLVIAAGIVVSRIPEQPPEAGLPRQARITFIEFHVTHIDSYAVVLLRGETDRPGGTACRPTD